MRIIDLSKEELEVLSKMDLSLDDLTKKAKSKPKTVVTLKEYTLKRIHTCSLCGTKEAFFFKMAPSEKDGVPYLRAIPLPLSPAPSYFVDSEIESSVSTCKSCFHNLSCNKLVGEILHTLIKLASKCSSTEVEGIWGKGE